MRKILILSLVAACFTQVALSQESPELKIDTMVRPPVVADEDDIVFSKVEEEATFPGGASAFKMFLQKNLNTSIPDKNNAPAGVYTVMIRFIVRKDGSIISPVAETMMGYGMEQEVIRLIKKSPNWIPARQNGFTVNAYRRQPLTFVVSEK